MIDSLETILPIIIYILLIILIVVGIILGIKSIKSLEKIDRVVDDVNDKLTSLNGVFNFIDFTTDKIVSITDKVVDGLSGLFGNLFFRKKKNKQLKEEDEDE